MIRSEFLTKLLAHMRDTAPEWLISQGQIRRRVSNTKVFACAISSLENKGVEEFKGVASRLGLDPCTINDVVSAADYPSCGLAGAGKREALEIRQQMLEAIGKEESK